MLSIKDFSEMAHLSAQTLRYYHAEGLLVPARVDEQTGYRSYTFDQVEEAMLITVLRQAGLGVKQIRRALDEPDVASALLDEHLADVQQQREKQDDAIRTARCLFAEQPEPCVRSVPVRTVVSRPAPVTPLGRDEQEWDRTEEILAAAAEDLIKTVELCGAKPAGSPWRVLAPGAAVAGDGPVWLVQVAVDGHPARPAELPADAEVREYAAGEELSIVMPGRNSMVKYCAAVARLFAYPLDDAFLDVTRLRHLIRADGVEFSVPICSP